MGPVERGLLRRRRANLDASRLAMHARDNSSPGQSPDTSLEGWTHGAWREEDQTVQEVFTSVLELRRSGNRGTELALELGLLLVHARVALNCDIVLNLMS